MLTETFAIQPKEKLGAESAQVLYLNMSGKRDNAFIDDGWCKVRYTMKRQDSMVDGGVSFCKSLKVIKFNNVLLMVFLSLQLYHENPFYMLVIIVRVSQKGMEK